MVRLFLKLLVYDIRVGFGANKALFVLAALVFSTLALIVHGQTGLPYVVDPEGIKIPLTEEFPSSVDYLLFFFKGMRAINPASQEPFQLPVFWVAIQVSIALLVALYPVRDLYSYAPQNIVRAQSKLVWWLAKCFWAIATVLAFYGICLVVVLISGIASGGGVFEPNILLERFLNGLDVTRLSGADMAFMFLMPVVVSLALSLVQVLLSFVITPMMSFVALMSYHLISIIVFSPFFIADYPMILRNGALQPNGLSSVTMLLVGCGIAIAAIVIGIPLFKRKDLYPR